MIKSNECKKLLKKFKLNIHFFKKLPAAEKRVTGASVITLIRLILIIPIVGSMIMHSWGIASILFSLAALSDTCDGMYARFFNEKTVLGACLDPLADKLLVFSCFATLAFVESPVSIVPRFFVVIIFCKELLQLVGSLIVWAIHGHIEIHPTALGKTTTGIQMFFIVCLLLSYHFHWIPAKTYYYSVLVVMIILMGLTFAQYARMGFSYIKYSLYE